MHKAYNEELLVQTKIIEGDFQVMLPLNREGLIITTGFFHILAHPTVIRMGKQGNIQHPAHTNMFVHRPRNGRGQHQNGH